MKKLTINYIASKRMVLLLIILIVTNYSFNLIFNYTYLLPLNLFLLMTFYFFMQFLFPYKFELLREDLYMLLIIIYSLTHSLYFETYDYTLLVIGMSFVPYFFSRFITLEDRDIDFFIKVLYLIGILLLGVYYHYVGFGAVEGRFRVDGRHPVAIAADFGLAAIIFSYVLFTSKNYFVKILSFCLILAAFYLTVFVLATRGASFTGMAAITGLYFMLSDKSFKDRFKSLVVIVIFISIFLLIINHKEFIAKYPMLERFTLEGMLKDPSLVGSRKYTGRTDLMRRSIVMIINKPFWGAGMGSIYSHNILLEWSASLGLVGLFPFLFFLSSIFIKSIKHIKSNPRFALFFILLIYTFVLRLVSFAMISHKAFFALSGLFLSYYYTFDESDESDES